jgi:hypothetical protein
MVQPFEQHVPAARDARYDGADRIDSIAAISGVKNSSTSRNHTWRNAQARRSPLSSGASARDQHDSGVSNWPTPARRGRSAALSTISLSSIIIYISACAIQGGLWRIVSPGPGSCLSEAPRSEAFNCFLTRSPASAGTRVGRPLIQATGAPAPRHEGGDTTKLPPGRHLFQPWRAERQAFGRASLARRSRRTMMKRGHA